MPHIPEFETGQPKDLIMSVGGSVLNDPKDPVHFNCDFIGRLVEFTRNHLKNQSVIAVIGGGHLARVRIADMRCSGVTDETKLDLAGIQVTWFNANQVKTILEENKIPVGSYEFGKPISRGVVYVRGGDKPGVTTDKVAVDVARELGARVMINIGSTPGLYATNGNGELITDSVIDRIDFDKYLALFPGRHTAGENIPFDRDASRTADENGITVILVNGDFGNIDRCLQGKEFTGTILSPTPKSAT